MLGYLAFLALIFLPGLSATLALRQVKGNLISLLARSYGLSLVLNSLVGFADSFVGVSFSLVALLELTVSLSVITMVGALERGRKLSAWLSGQKFSQQAPAALLGIVYSLLLLVQFTKFPIFPKTYSVDFIQHTQLVSSLLQSNGSGQAWTLLYGGVHYNLAMGLSLEGGITITQLPYLMAVIAAPSSLLFYELARRLYGGSREALLTQVLLVATGFVWYVPLYDSGLYPNIYSIIVSLAYMLELVRLNETKSVRNFLLLAIISLGLYLSHYSVVVFIAAVDIFLLYRVVRRAQSLKFFLGVVLANLAPVVFVLFRPDLLSFATQIIGSTGATGAFGFTTPLANVFQFSPFLRYLVAEVYGYSDVALLILALPVALYYVLSRRKQTSFLPVLFLWVGLLWFLAPQGELAWRFSNQALAPILLLASASFEPILRTVGRILPSNRSRARRGRGVVRRRVSVARTTVITGILLILVFAGSWTNIMLSDVSSDTGVYSHAQLDLYDSMVWFNKNAPPGASLLSVTDWRISFMQDLTGRTGTLLMLANSSRAISAAGPSGYILVTYLIPADVPAGFDLASFYNSFSHSSGLKQVYNNTFDVVYQVTAT